jgi:hypothetical protein
VTKADRQLFHEAPIRPHPAIAPAGVRRLARLKASAPSVSSMGDQG